jgi:hypothetical protein
MPCFSSEAFLAVTRKKKRERRSSTERNYYKPAQNNLIDLGLREN